MKEETMRLCCMCIGLGIVCCVCQLVTVKFASRLSSVDADCLAGNVSNCVQILRECDMVTPKNLNFSRHYFRFRIPIRFHICVAHRLIKNIYKLTKSCRLSSWWQKLCNDLFSTSLNPSFTPFDLIAGQANPLLFLPCFFLLSVLPYSLPRVHSAFVFFTASLGKDFLLSKPLTNEKSNGREVGAYKLQELYTPLVYKMNQNKKTMLSHCSGILKLWNVSQLRYKEKHTHELRENLITLHARWKYVEVNQVQLHLFLTLELAGGAVSSVQGPLCLGKRARYLPNRTPLEPQNRALRI